MVITTPTIRELGQHAADGRPAGAATPVGTEADELLDTLPLADLARVDVALGIETDLVQPVELAGLTPAPPEPAELLKIAPVEDVNRHVGVVADIETGLVGVGREVHRDRRARQ